MDVRRQLLEWLVSLFCQYQCSHMEQTNLRCSCNKQLLNAKPKIVSCLLQSLSVTEIFVCVKEQTEVFRAHPGNTDMKLHLRILNCTQRSDGSL